MGIMINLIYTIDWSDVCIVEDMKFKRKLFGGLDKISVMKQIEKLNQEYKHMYEEERIKHEAILDEKNKEIEKLRSRPLSNDRETS